MTVSSPGSPDLSRASRKSILLFPSCIVLFWGSVYIYMPILAPYAQSVTGSLQAVGLVVGAYGFSQVLLRIPLGMCSDRLGRRKPFILLGFLFDCLASLGLILSHSTAMLFLSVFTAGIASSTWVAFAVLYSSYFPVSHIARSMSLILFFTRLSQILTTYTGGAAAEAWGWMAPFYIGAILSLAGLLLATGVNEPRMEKRVPASFQRLLLVGRNRTLLVFSALSILIQFSISSTTTGFTPIYAQEIGASKGELGTLLFSFMLPTSLATLLSGTYIRHRLPERFIISAGFFLTAGSILLTPFVNHLGMLYFIQGLNGIGVGLASPLLMGSAIQSFEVEEQATAMGFYQSIYAVGMSLGPIVSGVFAQRLGLSSVFILNSLLCLGGAVYSFIKNPEPL